MWDEHGDCAVCGYMGAEVEEELVGFTIACGGERFALYEHLCDTCNAWRLTGRTAPPWHGDCNAN